MKKVIDVDGDVEAWAAHWQQCSGGAKNLTKEPRHRSYFNSIRAAFGGSFVGRYTMELGAGRATVSQLIAMNGGTVSCCDYSPEPKAMAAANFKKAGVGFERYVIGDAARTGLVGELYYDLVFSVGVIEHFDRPERLHQEALALATDGGMVYHIAIQPTASNVGKFYRNDWTADDYREQFLADVREEAPNILHIITRK